MSVSTVRISAIQVPISLFFSSPLPPSPFPSVRRSNCYMVWGGDATSSGHSSSRSNVDLEIGCLIDLATGLVTFTVNGKELATSYQVLHCQPHRVSLYSLSPITLYRFRLLSAAISPTVSVPSCSLPLIRPTSSLETYHSVQISSLLIVIVTQSSCLGLRSRVGAVCPACQLLTQRQAVSVCTLKTEKKISPLKSMILFISPVAKTR